MGANISRWWRNRNEIVTELDSERTQEQYHITGPRPSYENRTGQASMNTHWTGYDEMRNISEQNDLNTSVQPSDEPRSDLNINTRTSPVQSSEPTQVGGWATLPTHRNLVSTNQDTGHTTAITNTDSRHVRYLQVDFLLLLAILVGTVS